MENKESRKIGWTFLGFSTIFYRFPKLDRKRKRELMNSLGLKPAQLGPARAETRPRTHARGDFANKTLQF